MRNPIVFTDLDGTLLNHDDYAFASAMPMISRLKRDNIPLIFVTSKTKEECEILQEKMQIDAPFVVENGAAIYGLEAMPIVLGVEVAEIRRFLDRVWDRFGIRAFYQMSVDEVIEVTGFDESNAKLAKARSYSEPFFLSEPSELDALQAEAKESGLKILKGGRFYHCVGGEQDKGRAVQVVCERMGADRTTIALGDNYNDLDMLRVVDIPILMPLPDQSFIRCEIVNVRKAPASGAKGWNAILEEILNG